MLNNRCFPRLPIALLCCCITAAALAGEQRVKVVDRPDAAAGNDYYVGNRPPLKPSPVMKLPVGAVEPRGWVRHQLELMAKGYVGHLSDFSKYLKKKDNAWLSPDGKGKHGWEEVPYWLRGFGDLGYLLDNQRIIGEAKTWLDAVIASQRDSGYFGPAQNLGHKAKGEDAAAAQTKTAKGTPDLWPNMIMLDALRSYYEYSGDKRVIKLMSRYFRWESTIPQKHFTPRSWQHIRAGDNLASIYWLYNRTGEKWLLDLARKNHKATAEWGEGLASHHGVNLAQGFREPAQFYQQSLDAADLHATLSDYHTFMQHWGQVPGGMFGADERARPGHPGPHQAAESCSLVEMMNSSEMLIRITGDPAWADHAEDVAFNSLPASTTPDYNGLHYLTAPNQVPLVRGNMHPVLQNHGTRFVYKAKGYRCCQHNTSQGWPYFAEHQWMATAGNGLAAMLYGPSSVHARVGDGTKIHITEKTGYPFDDQIQLALATPRTVRFPLYLRVPGWCEKPAVQVNGQVVKADARPDSYIRIERDWADGDTLTLTLPMHIRVKRWKGNKNSASVERGPLTYSLKIGEKYVRVGGSDRWPKQEVHATTRWNYGLVLGEKDPASTIKLAHQADKLPRQPFRADQAPIRLEAKAKRLPEWQLNDVKMVGAMQQSPVASDQPTRTVTLIPMGAARLRISAFPVIGEGPDAHHWHKPEPVE